MIFSPEDNFETVDKGHGRLEYRNLQTATIARNSISFPYSHQIFRIERRTTILKTGKERHEIVYGITSLTKKKVNAERLLSLVRGHWHIENRLHWVRDVTYDEDRSQIRTGTGPRMMASLRNISISLCRLLGYDNIAKATREFGWDHEYSLRVLGL